MALSQEILNESELAKSYITNSDFDDNYKKSLLSLINLTTLSTNGISPEEKIQKMTEAIHLLAITQVSFITKVDEKIEKSITNANIRQCSSCKAMKHALKAEEEEKKQEIINAYKIANGINDDEDIDEDTYKLPKTWAETLKTILMKPYFWVFASILAISPYGCEVIKMIIQTYKN